VKTSEVTKPDYWMQTTPILMEVLAERSEVTPLEVCEVLADAVRTNPTHTANEVVRAYREEFTDVDQ
jgi:hypothetical protein